MEATSPRGTQPIRWVSTDWLEQRLDDQELTVLDTQPNIHDYITEHVPGAVYMNEGILRVPLDGRPGAWVSAACFEHAARRLGLSADRPVVVCTGTGPFKNWGDGLEQTMVAYSLARFGHPDVLILDGGVDRWKAEGRPLTKAFPRRASSDFHARIRPEFFVEYEEFRRIKDRDDVVVQDASPRAVYAGQGPWIKPGHIPGAVNLPWASLMDPGNTRLLKPESEIRKLMEERGITPDKTVIASCGTGREATNPYVIFRWLLGFPKVRIYEGSFTEWSSFPDNPTVTGPNPR